MAKQVIADRLEIIIPQKQQSGARDKGKQPLARLKHGHGANPAQRLAWENGLFVGHTDLCVGDGVKSSAAT